MTPQNKRATLEVCVDTPDAITACAVVADRIELCSGLDVGGLTPDFGMMEHAANESIETHVLIRPRSGDFIMSNEDILVAQTNIKTVRDLGLKGVVIGAERHGVLDRIALEAMALAADGLDITLHRVIDVVDEPEEALEFAIEIGAKRILTSGGKKSAAHGIEGLNRLHAKAAGRIEIMAGSGINSANIESLMNATQITSFHASCSRADAIEAKYGDFGFGRSKRVFDAVEAGKLATLIRKITV